MFPETVFFGLLPKLHTLRDALIYREIPWVAPVWQGHFGRTDVYNREGWEAIEKLGYLPLSIKAVPEGTVVPVKNVLMTIENTDPRFPWLTNWVETILMQVWYPITVATLSREIKRLLFKYYQLTGSDTAGINFKLHDFGFRGVSSIESAAIGGAAHLVNFLGTDTAVALEFLNYFYKAPLSDTECPGSSVPAAEHSTITSWGKSREAEAYDNMLDQFNDGIIAVVSDSYNIYDACKHIWGDKLKAHVLDRNGTVVVRPDSGYPPEVVVRCLDILGEAFGTTRNEKGFKILNPKIGLIQGDGVDYDMIRNVLHAMLENGWAAQNVAFGMGGALLQKLNRDTQMMALKCSETVCDGEVLDVYKDPITDSGKASHRGRLALVKDQNGELITVHGPREDDLLVEVFRDGKILQEPSLAEIREKAKL